MKHKLRGQLKPKRKRTALEILDLILNCYAVFCIVFSIMVLILGEETVMAVPVLRAIWDGEPDIFIVFPALCGIAYIILRLLRHKKKISSYEEEDKASDND